MRPFRRASAAIFHSLPPRAGSRRRWRCRCARCAGCPRTIARVPRPPPTMAQRLVRAKQDQRRAHSGRGAAADAARPHAVMVVYRLQRGLCRQRRRRPRASIQPRGHPPGRTVQLCPPSPKRAVFADAPHDARRAARTSADGISSCSRTRPRAVEPRADAEGLASPTPCCAAAPAVPTSCRRQSPRCTRAERPAQDWGKGLTRRSCKCVLARDRAQPRRRHAVRRSCQRLGDHRAPRAR
jgi:hypothetical protein